MTAIRVALIGWGAIGRTVADLLDPELAEIVAVGVRDAAVARSGIPDGAVLVSEPGQITELGVDVVAEAAGRESVGPWGLGALRSGADFIVSSVSALADPKLLEALGVAASDNGAQLRIQTGALGGIDALAGARLMGVDRVEHRIVKPPNAWLGTPAEQLVDLESLVDAVEFSSDSAAVIATEFPKNANVAMTTALAGIGSEATTITLVADPAATTNRHEIHATGSFGTLEVSIANNPLPANPKTSAMAALNLAKTIQNLVAPIVIG